MQNKHIPAAEQGHYKQTEEVSSSSEKAVASETWAPRRVTSFPPKQSVSLNTSYFKGQRLINCFPSSSADPLVRSELIYAARLCLDNFLQPISRHHHHHQRNEDMLSNPAHLHTGDKSPGLSSCQRRWKSSRRNYWERCWLQQVTRYEKGFWLIHVCKHSWHIIKELVAAKVNVCWRSV